MTTARLPGSTLTAGQLIRRGWTWWLNELTALIPFRLLWLVGRQDHAAIVLEASADDAALVMEQRGSSPPLRIPLSGCDAATIRARVSAVTRHRRTGNAATVRLDPSLVLESSLTLPLSAESSLRAVLQHQLERVVPLSARDVCFEYRLAPRMPGAKELTAYLFIATHASVDRALSLAREAGLNPRLLTTSRTADGGEPVVLWRAGRERIEKPWQRRVRQGLEVTAILLALAAFGLYVHRLDLVRDQLQAEIDEATRAATAARQLSQQIVETNDAVTLVQRRVQAVSPLRLISELTELVPDSSWITQLVVRDRTVEIIGFSQRATDLISRIEGSAIFEKPQFRAPITLSTDGRGERFDLTFEIGEGASR